MKKLLLLILPLFVLTACSNDDNSNATSEEINFSTVGKNALNGNGNILQSNLVFNNQADWNNFLTQLDEINNVSATFNETEINFTAFTVIAVIDEIKTSGSEINIVTAVESTNTITISSELTMYSTTVISQPFHIIKIPKTNKQIIFN